MFRFLTCFVVLVACAIGAQTAGASVAYIDANEVWVSTDDGAQKVRLSAGQGDWREVAQSDQGYIVGTRKESGKISQLAFFTIWDPTGKLIHFGSLSGAFTSGLNTYPLSLDITPSGGNIVYGFSANNSDYSSAGKGIYLKVSSDASTGVPNALTKAQNPTLVGNRIVGAMGESVVGLQDPSNLGNDIFNGWFDTNVGAPGSPYYGLKLTRSDVSATGTLVATELRDDSFNTQKIGVWKYASLGGAYVDDCTLPASGLPSDVSFSQDGSLLAWRDSRGVVLGGSPNLRPGGPPICEMPAPRVISATGVYPSYGPFNVAAALTPPVVPKPKLTVGSSLKLTSLKSGAKISVTSAVAGKAKLTLTIKPSKVGKKGKKLITLASGSANVAANVPKTIKLKFTSAGKKLKKKLKNKKATLTLSVGGQTTSKSVKLK
jgi:hypothetical protein